MYMRIGLSVACLFNPYRLIHSSIASFIVTFNFTNLEMKFFNQIITCHGGQARIFHAGAPIKYLVVSYFHQPCLIHSVELHDLK